MSQCHFPHCLCLSTEDCTTFNGDSDVDEGEDEITLQPDGTATRYFRHRKSWMDGHGNNGKPRGSDRRHAVRDGEQVPGKTHRYRQHRCTDRRRYRKLRIDK